MKIDLDQYLTIDQTCEALGCNRRAVYRAIKRAKAAGKDVSVVVLGKILVLKKAVATVKQFYFPYYSEAHQRMVKQWGAAGGRQSGVTKRKRAARA